MWRAVGQVAQGAGGGGGSGASRAAAPAETEIGGDVKAWACACAFFCAVIYACAVQYTMCDISMYNIQYPVVQGAGGGCGSDASRAAAPAETEIRGEMKSIRG